MGKLTSFISKKKTIKLIKHYLIVLNIYKRGTITSYQTLFSLHNKIILNSTTHYNITIPKKSLNQSIKPLTIKKFIIRISYIFINRALD